MRRAAAQQALGNFFERVGADPLGRAESVAARAEPSQPRTTRRIGRVDRSQRTALITKAARPRQVTSEIRARMSSAAAARQPPPPGSLTLLRQPAMLVEASSFRRTYFWVARRQLSGVSAGIGERVRFHRSAGNMILFKRGNAEPVQ